MARRRKKDEAMTEIEYQSIAHETDKAILFTIPTYGNETKDVWVPRSLLGEHDEDEQTIEVPEWLAAREGLA